LVTRSTKATMAFLVCVSFHDGNGSPAVAVWAVAERGTSVDKAGSAAKAESNARRLGAENEAFVLIDCPFQQEHHARAKSGSAG
jgi:hypothetical protein